MGFVRLIVFGLIGMTAAYFMISIYSRSVRREKLENRWAEKNPDSEDMTARAIYVQEGLAEYEAGFRPKLILLVYIVPTVMVVMIHILTTYY
ncbi:MAG: hypothetical protein ABJI96_01420 [Paracoccaceae bacterium]